MRTVWDEKTKDRLRWAYLGPPSIDRSDALYRLAKDLGISWAAITTQASSMGLLTKGRGRKEP